MDLVIAGDLETVEGEAVHVGAEHLEEAVAVGELQEVGEVAGQRVVQRP